MLFSFSLLANISNDTNSSFVSTVASSKILGFKLLSNSKLLFSKGSCLIL